MGQTNNKIPRFNKPNMKGLQTNVQNLIPQKHKKIFTSAIKTLVETGISDSSLLTFNTYYKMAISQKV